MSLRYFIDKFKDDMLVIKEPVDKKLEISKYLLSNMERTVFFENLSGYRAVGNIWATRERIARALGIKKEEIMNRLLEAMKTPEPAEVVEKAPFYENVFEKGMFDLRKLPIPTYYPKDAGPYITSGVVIAEDGKKRNMSFHRMLVLDENRFAIRLVPRHLYAMHKKAVAENRDLPIAVAIGLCPPILLPAAMSVSFETDELAISNALRKLTLGKGIELTRTKGGIAVPTYAEYIFEGRITRQNTKEGPFVDITGTYDEVRDQPIVEIDRIYHRNEPIFHALMPGGYEHFLMMGMPREPVIYDYVRGVVPNVHGVRLTEGGCCWLHGVVSIEQQKQGDGKNAIMAALAAHPSMKRVTVVDKDIDIFDDRAVEWAVATRFQANEDLVVVNNASGSSLDKSSNHGVTSKVGLDATMPLKSEGEFIRATLDGEIEKKKNKR